MCLREITNLETIESVAESLLLEGKLLMRSTFDSKRFDLYLSG